MEVAIAMLREDMHIPQTPDRHLLEKARRVNVDHVIAVLVCHKTSAITDEHHSLLALNEYGVMSL